MKLKHLLAASVLLGSCLAIPSARASVTASVFELKIYKFAVSTSEDCSNPIIVYENAAPEYSDFAKGPTFGSWHLADGTYKCVMFEMSDHIRYTPGTNEGACLQGKAYTDDVCRKHGDGGSGGGGGPNGGPGDGGPGEGGSGGGGPNGGPGGGPGDGGPNGGGGGGMGGGKEEVVTLLDGTTFTCQDGDVDERVAVYLSIASSDTQHGNAFSPPTSASDTARGIKLGSPLIVNGAAIGTFVVDAHGKISSGMDNGVEQCGMDPPDFSFE